jgi:hypothetical protein
MRFDSSFDHCQKFINYEYFNGLFRFQFPISKHVQHVLEKIISNFILKNMSILNFDQLHVEPTASLAIIQDLRSAEAHTAPIQKDKWCCNWSENSRIWDTDHWIIEGSKDYNTNGND